MQGHNFTEVINGYFWMAVVHAPSGLLKMECRLFDLTSEVGSGRAGLEKRELASDLCLLLACMHEAVM